MAFPLLSLIPTAVSAVGGYFNKRQDIKKAKVSAEAKLALKKETGDQSIALTDAEWEAISARGLGVTWKDEYVTLIITAPIVLILGGAVWQAFTGDQRLLDGVLEGISRLAALGLDWGTLTLAVVLAAIGLKVWRAK